MKASIDVALSTPFEYHHKGAKAEAQKVVLKAPFSNVRNLTTQLKQSFFRALKFHEKSRPAGPAAAAPEVLEKDVEMDGRQILSLMFMSDVDMEDFMKTFKNLITSPGLCLIDGVEQMTGHVFDKLSDEDADNIVGEYLSNFITSSLMKNLTSQATG